MVQIKTYDGNRKALVKFLEDLQDHVIKIDPLNRFVRLPAYGETYTDEIFEEVIKRNGKILFAEQNGVPIGVIVGIIDELPEQDLLGCIPSKMGTIVQLFVEDKYRGKHVGSLLIEEIEKYFKNQGCDVVYVGTLKSNIKAREFYNKKGYCNRIIEMMKII
ncbi:MAG: GNAT family N-acetyltransferase [Bacteroidota bacterium]